MTLFLINQIDYNTTDHQIFHGYPFENMLNTVTMEDTFENLINGGTLLTIYTT